MLSNFGTGGKTQDNTMSKEEARIKYKREQNEQRAARLQNGKARAIGLDIDALDAQVVEARYNRQQAKDADKMERYRLQEIDKVIESHNEDERRQKILQTQQLKSSWEDAVVTKRNTLVEPEFVFDPSKTGLSAVQNFIGEDPQKRDRVKAQKEQIRRWVQEQVSEKANIRRQEYEEDMNYSYAIRNVDDIREALEREEFELRRAKQLEITKQNKELSKTKTESFAKTQEEFTRLSAEEKGKLTSLDLFNEDTGAAMNEHGRVVQKDRFKGFTPEQRRRILQENEVVIQQKREIQEQEKQIEQQWAMQKAMLTRALDVASTEERAMQEAEKEVHFSVLQRQRDDERTRRESATKERFGKIESGFFSNFGTSSR